MITSCKDYLINSSNQLPKLVSWADLLAGFKEVLANFLLVKLEDQQEYLRLALW